MITRKYQLEELAKARILSDELAKLHVPSTVMLWRYKVTDVDGTITEKGIGKANSYTRNALNNLAYFVGFSESGINKNSGFGDGYTNQKTTSGTIYAYNASQNMGRFMNNGYNPRVYLGTGTTEMLDDYAAPAYACTSSISSSFNTTTRKLITTLAGTYANTSGSTINITESGITLPIGGSGSNDSLVVHDVFDAIALENNKTITWTYVTEVAYPNP